MRGTAWLIPLVFVAVAAAQQESAPPQAQIDSTGPPPAQSPPTSVTARPQTTAGRETEPAPAMRPLQEKIPPLTKPPPLKPYNLERQWVKTSRERIAETRRRLRTAVGQVRTKTWELRQVFIPNNTEAPPSNQPLGTTQPGPRPGQPVPEAASAERPNAANQ